jgi:glutamine cyclotransferase
MLFSRVPACVRQVFEIPQGTAASAMKSVLCLCALILALAAPAAQAEPPNYGYTVVHVYPHDPHAYTEGLFYLGGFLYESTGQVGE